MESLCLFCQNPTNPTPGKRTKNFCSAKCRAAYWQQNTREPKTVQRATYDKLSVDYSALRNEMIVLREENDRLKERLQTFEGNPESEQSQKIKKHIEDHELTPKKVKSEPSKKYLDYKGYEEKIEKMDKPSSQEVKELIAEINDAPALSGFEKRVLISALK